MSMFTSPPDAVGVHPSGWARWTLPSGRVIEVTRLPLFDSKNGVFARLTYKQAASGARALGGRLLVREEVDDIWERGFKTKPVTLDPTPQMMSLEWARKHDAGVLPQLTLWDRVTPVANVGKDYLDVAPPGKQHYYGWIDASGVALQPDYINAHNDNYSDYSQLTRVARDIVGTPGPSTPSKPKPPGTKPPLTPGASSPDEGMSGGTMVLLVGGLVLGGILLANHFGDA